MVGGDRRLEEYSRVASLIEAGELPKDFKVPGDGKPPDDADDELLLSRLQESPDIEPFLDRAFFDHLGCSYGWPFIG